jgi:hypothetical protein
MQSVAIKSNTDAKQALRRCVVSFISGMVTTMFLGALGAWLCLGHYQGKQASAAVQIADRRVSAKVPAWGKIIAKELPLANTSAAYPDSSKRLQKAAWNFEGISEDRVARFLNTCELLPAQKRALLNKCCWNATSNGCVLYPPPQLVWFMDSRSRERIYSVLSKDPVNYNQAYPFRFPVNEFESQFREGGLALNPLKLLERMAYRENNFVCFSDLEAARQLLSPQEFQSVLETLYTLPAYSLRLKVTPQSDVEELIKYWGRGGREKLIGPLLKAMSKVPGGGSINLSRLLPPFARLRLDTYPDSWPDPTAHLQDCVVSSLNFFNDRPDTNFLDRAYSQKVLDTEYAQVQGDAGFGDLLVFLDSRGALAHMCVNIADNFVFTKNGINPAMPWVLMRLSDTTQIYFSPDEPGRVLILRRKFPERAQAQVVCELKPRPES